MNITRIAVIIRHEVLTRIRTRAFILATLLTPLAVAAITVLPTLVAVWTSDSVTRKVIVCDPAGVLTKDLVAEDPELFAAGTSDEEELKVDLKNDSIKAFLVIPSALTLSDTVKLYTGGGGGLGLHGRVRDAVRNVIRHRRIMSAGATPEVLSAMDMPVPYKARSLDESGEKTDAAEFKSVLGYILSFIIYMAMFVYGGLVMRAVLEEKTNRIVEVLASSAKPFEIMFGKILGVACVGLLQMITWIVLGTIVSAVVGAQYAPSAMAGAQASQAAMPKLVEFMASIAWWVPVVFILYFLAGYFLYSALFAAVAAAANQEQDIQSLQLPVSLPLMIPFLFIGAVMNDPDGTLATVMSMIPMFTPTIMIIRIMSTQVPVWQIVLSSAGLVLSFVGAVWAAGRIYRVGILTFGKKASYRDMMRWLIRG